MHHELFHKIILKNERGVMLIFSKCSFILRKWNESNVIMSCNYIFTPCWYENCIDLIFDQAKRLTALILYLTKPKDWASILLPHQSLQYSDTTHNHCHDHEKKNQECCFESKHEFISHSIKSVKPVLPSWTQFCLFFNHLQKI